MLNLLWRIKTLLNITIMQTPLQWLLNSGRQRETGIFLPGFTYYGSYLPHWVFDRLKLVGFFLRYRNVWRMSFDRTTRRWEGAADAHTAGSLEDGPLPGLIFRNCFTHDRRDAGAKTLWDAGWKQCRSNSKSVAVLERVVDDVFHNFTCLTWARWWTIVSGNM